MLQRNQEGLKVANILSDLALIVFSCIFAWLIRYDVLDGVVSVETTGVSMAMLIAAYSLVSVMVLYISNIYAPQRLRKAGGNTLRIFACNGFCSLLLLSILYIFKIMDMSRGAVLINYLLSSLLVSGKHILLHAILHHMREKGYNLRHFVIVGNGRQAHEYLNNVRENAYTGVVVDGYVSAVERPELGKCLGSYEDLEEILTAGSYDGLIVALEPHEIRFLKTIMDVADKVGIQIDLIPFYNDYYPTYPIFERIGTSKLIDLRATPLNHTGNATVKRGLDILFSALFLIALSPLMLVVAIGVKVSSPGPVIFKQERVGRNKKPFTMYKFRSMRASQSEDTAWTQETDSRRTAFGSLIRKFSIDELPQFWNVLKGDMSIIGPRPEIPYHVNHFKEEIPRYLVRQGVRPGITGWAQVNGYRGDTDVAERVRMDIWYIENWSLGLDFKIVAKTIFGGMINREK